MPKDTRIEFEIPAGTFSTVGLAALSGARSMAGPAFLSRGLRRSDVHDLSDTPFAALASDGVSAALKLLLVGEMVADKTSLIPARVSAPALFGRALSGAVVGSALFAARDGRSGSGAVLGVVSAVAGTYLADGLRKTATQNAGVPDAVIGHLEDALVLFLGPRLSKVR